MGKKEDCRFNPEWVDEEKFPKFAKWVRRVKKDNQKLASVLDDYKAFCEW